MHTIITKGLGDSSTGSSLVTKGYGSQEVTPSQPTFNSKYQRLLYERGIKFANAPPNSICEMQSDGARLQHINNVQTFAMSNSDVVNRTGNYSGAVKFRFRDYRKVPVPASINVKEYRNLDEFGNIVLSFTGKND